MLCVAAVVPHDGPGDEEASDDEEVGAGSEAWWHLHFCFSCCAVLVLR